MPAPLPFPTPPSAPLASASGTSATPLPANSGPSVTSYVEQYYSCQRGDTWDSISQYFYKTDRYAAALRRHNQIHARASEQMARTGQTAEGERVFIPQVYVLEDRYADAIPKPSASPAPTMVPTTFTPAGGAPMRPNP
ncbi:MAG: hypothetical protein ACYC3I_15675 [Gemmataceae bacterium]